MKTNLIWMAALALATQALAQVETWTANAQGADRMILARNGDVVTKRTVETASPGTGSDIGRRPSDSTGPTGSGVFWPSPNTQSIPGNIADGGDGKIWFFFNGRIHSSESSRRSPQVHAQVPDPSRLSPNSLLAPSLPYGDYASSSSPFFLTDETGEFLDAARLWRLRPNGFEGAELVADRSSGPSATWFKALAVVSPDEVVALMGNRRLSRFVRSTSSGSPVWTEQLIDPDAFSMVVRTIQLSRYETTKDLFWAAMDASGTQVILRRAPLNNLTSPVTLGTEAAPYQEPFQSMAVAAGGLYYQIGNALRRRSAEDFTFASEDVALLDHQALHLFGTDRYLFWLRNSPSSVMRLPVGSAAITRNLAITGMEVIQAIQSPANDVPLVADKTTHARVYARIMESSAGETSIAPPNPVLLHGERDGVPLPGSPLVAGNLTAYVPPLTDAPMDRMNEYAGYWFRLPESWSRAGATVLRAELNPARLPRETNYADNVLSRTANFAQKVPVGIKLIPTWTHYGTIDRRRGNHREIWEQASHLFPTSSLRVEYPRTPRIEERDGFLGLDGTSPYEFTPHDDDSMSVLHALFWRKVEGAGGTLAEPGGFDHYLALVPEASLQNGWGGMAPVGDSISVTHASLIVGNDLSFDALGSRFDAITLAHELAHNYGRAHVAGCRSPSGTDSSYPYAGGTISDETAGHLGFNAYRRRLLPLWGTGDLQSYCAGRWISDYTWKALYHRVSDGYGPAAAPVAMAEPSATEAVPRGLTGGVIDLANNKAAMRHAFDLGEEAWQRALANSGPAGSAWQLRAYSGAFLKATFPVAVLNGSFDCHADVPPPHLAWFAAMEDLSGVDKLELVNAQNPTTSLVNLTGGGAAPTVTVLEPVGGPVGGETLLIKWQSSDDGSNPLRHIVRMRPDSDAPWRVLASEYAGQEITVNVADLPGGPKCLIEVVASDGILCGRGVSQEFVIPNQPPAARILFENSKRLITTPLSVAEFDPGELLRLHAEVEDIEDGWLADDSIEWSLSGPISVTGAGRRFEPNDLAPGWYSVTLSVTDSAGSTTQATAGLRVRQPFIPDAEGLFLPDGWAEETGYAMDLRPKWLRMPGGGNAARIVWVRNEDRICLAVHGLPSSKDGDSKVVLAISPGYGETPEPTSLRIDVSESNDVRFFRGDGLAWVEQDGATGIISALVRDGNAWSVEIFIDVDLLPPDAGLFGGRFYAGLFDGAGGNFAQFPSGAGLEAMGTWAMSAFGDDPEASDDEDEDGMPDRWETARFGVNGSGPGQDSDGDGAVDALEFVAGTDPNDASSVFSARIEAGHGLSWSSAPERTYSVWRSADLHNWEEVAEGIPHSFYGMGRTFWTDTSPLAGRAFYRIMVHGAR